MMLLNVTRNGLGPPSSKPPREAATLAAIQCYVNCTAVIQCNRLCLCAQTWNPQAITTFYTSALALVSCSFLWNCSASEQKHCRPYQAAAKAKYVNIFKTCIQFSLPGRTYADFWRNVKEKSYLKRWWYLLLCVKNWFPIWTFSILKKNFFCSATWR